MKFVLLSIFLAWFSVSWGQFKQGVERNAILLKEFASCLEGYGEALAGETIQYPRLRTAASTALLTRATDGTMGIEWKTRLVQPPPGVQLLWFVVSAGMFAQEEPGRSFTLFINGVPRFVFRTTTKDSWAVTGDEGGSLIFDAVLRDQYHDAFGYLRIGVPVTWFAPGQPVRMKIVGERAGSNAWVMVYQDSTVMQYLRERVDHDAYCDVLIGTHGEANEARVTGPSVWIGRRLTYAIGQGPESAIPLAMVNGEASASFTFNTRGPLPLRILLDDEIIVALDSVGEVLDESKIFPKQLVRRTSRRLTPQTWLLEYRSTYLPELGMSLLELSGGAQTSGTVHLIVSSHQDIAWMDSPEQCIRDRDVKVITPALSLLQEVPDFCFDLEDVLELREYVDRHPERRDDIHRFIREGRLGIGATYNMPYEDLCSGEMLIRQFYAGKKWFKRNFPGCDTHTAWNPDVPGRSAQSAQIMHKAGVSYLLISRHERGLYDWRSPDGSRVMVFSPHHYGVFREQTAGKPVYEMASVLASFAREWRVGIPNGSANIPVLSMSDMSTPECFDEFLSTWNGLRSISSPDGEVRSLSLPFLHYSTAERFFREASRETLTMPILRGERPNLWLYIHGPTHHWAVSAKRDADCYLPSAETFSTVEALLSGSFRGYPQKELTEAWEAQLYPDHGWGGKNGQTTDSTFLAKYEFARDVARQLHSRATEAIAKRVQVAGDAGIPIIVFNSLSWKRSAPVECTTSFVRGAVPAGIDLRNASGARIPFQVLARTLHQDGSIKSVRFIFPAQDVPSVGYKTFYLRASEERVTEPAASRLDDNRIENAFYRVTLGRGGVLQIYDRELNVELLEPGKFLGGEVFTMQSVGEDAGEWAEVQQPTMEGFQQLSSYAPEWQRVESGPVREVVEFRQKVDHAQVVQRIALYHQLKQIDFEVSLLGWDGTRYREWRLAYPLNMRSARISYETPFSTVEIAGDEIKGAAGERYKQEVSSIHPRSIQNWISASDSAFGITLSSSVAVWDYKDPTPGPTASVLLQPVLLASRRSCHGEGNWYLQQGDHHYRFSLTSHRAGWANGRRFGVGSNAPLTAVLPDFPGRKGSLPTQMSFLTIEAENVALSTLKKAEDNGDVVVRLYECEGQAARSSIEFFVPLKGAQSTDILEEGGSPLLLQNGRLVRDVAHHSIETLRLELGIPQSR